MSNAQFHLFYSNITPLSGHAQEYVLSLPEYVKALFLVETHKDHQYVSEHCSLNGYNVSQSSPTPTSDTGSHGGELIAVKKHVASFPVPDNYME